MVVPDHTMKMRISAVLTALILFAAGPAAVVMAGMPLTETVATLPEGVVALEFREEWIAQNDGARRETIGINLGILPSFNVGFYLHYLHNAYFNSSDNEIGDSFLRLWLYCGDYFASSLHLGFLGVFRVPTGSNVYADQKWKNLSFGNNELKLGPVAQYDIGALHIHGNAFYVFREKHREGFYDGFHVNPGKKTTYQKLFGLNFKEDDTFLASRRLKNDYGVLSIAVNTGVWYPVIPYAGIYGSHTVAAQSDDDKALRIEGAGINPLLVYAGCRYFFTASSMMGLYCVINPLRQDGYIRGMIGAELNIQF